MKVSDFLRVTVDTYQSVQIEVFSPVTGLISKRYTVPPHKLLASKIPEEIKRKTIEIIVIYHDTVSIGVSG